MLKKSSSILCLLILIFCFSGCSYIAYKDYYYIENYSEIWDLEGFQLINEENQTLFPQETDNLNIKNFYCRHDEQLPLTIGVQIFLEVCYNESDFSIEKDRILSITKECGDYFKNSDLNAYSLYLGDENSSQSQYVLIDENASTIYYIYLQDLPKDEIEIDEKFLPDNYIGYGEIEASTN